ncbi:MAG: hypothetical protein E7442_07350 [Ruminococcaceae bacterium]|nr:hypothetical protein [Oscillospiraceae bacterium]
MKETKTLRRHRLSVEGELQETYSVEEALEAIQTILDRHAPDCKAKLFEKELEIRNGYKVRSRSDRLKISLILSRCGLTDREYDNLAAEWLLHNLAYDLHLMRGSARHVALDFGHNIRRIVDVCTRVLEIFGLV